MVLNFEGGYPDACTFLQDAERLPGVVRISTLHALHQSPHRASGSANGDERVFAGEAMNDNRTIRRRLAMAIPAAVIAAVAVLHWSGAMRRPNAQAMIRPAPVVAPSQARRPAWQTNWLGETTQRNLFLTRLDNFPRDVGTVQQPMRLPMPGGDSGMEAKSPPVSTDQTHDATQSAMAAEVSRIHLQSTMMHPVPRALVDGQMVGAGDFVGAFRVVRIELSRIVLEKQGYQFQITLK